MSELEALLVLNAIPGLGNARITKLIKLYGSAVKVLSLSQGELSALGRFLPQEVVQNILTFPQDKFLQRELALMKCHRVEAISIYDACYSEALAEIPDAPVILYVKGKIPTGKLAVGIVGSRQASIYGTTTANEFATRLAELGITVNSGMARGIDTAAHQGVLKVRGKTVAVLGCGLAHVYPEENAQLMDAIAASGAVISEYPMDVLPLSHNFPRRNRIISGLSLGVIVVEAREKSGALITADCALEQGRGVYAIPGKIDNPSARGVNNLVKQGAKLVTCIEDVLEDLKPHMILALKKELTVSAVLSPETEKERKLTEQEQNILNQLSNRPLHIDELQKSRAPVTAILLQLELKRLIRQLPGKLFIRI